MKIPLSIKDDILERVPRITYGFAEDGARYKKTVHDFKRIWLCPKCKCLMYFSTRGGFVWRKTNAFLKRHMHGQACPNCGSSSIERHCADKAKEPVWYCYDCGHVFR